MDIYTEILSALEVEDRVMLATVISTTGSTPAAALSKMLVKQQGAVSVGTVGGGCMEGDVRLQASRLYESGRARIVTFHLTEDDVEHGLICGGSLDVLIEPLEKGSVPLMQHIRSLREEGEDCVIATELLGDGMIGGKRLLRPDGSSFDSEGSTACDAELIQRALRRQMTILSRRASGDGDLILEPVFGRPALVIVGGGHVSKFVSRAATLAGFRVTVLDDREQFANAKRFPEAADTRVIDYDAPFSGITIKESTSVVIVTRGHHYDEQVLELAVRTPAKYIGMIGSVRKVLNAYRNLRGRGVSVEQLRRIHAPVGIDIGAVTAEEIAISIVAELVRVRRGASVPINSMSDRVFDLISNENKFSPEQ